MEFPSLTPSVRVFSPGVLPVVEKVAASGAFSGFRRGNRTKNQTLSLTFNNLTEANVNSIKDHYIDRNGTFDIFFLNAAVWSGYTTPPAPVVGVAWRYATAPVISDGIFGRWSVEVELKTHGILRGDLTQEPPASTDAAAAAADYIYDAGDSTTVARDYLLNPGAS
tara:strand:- start:200 stop:697 length:498 start_codon:yes stop_codon:yes gene_type:complete